MERIFSKPVYGATSEEHDRGLQRADKISFLYDFGSVLVCFPLVFMNGREVAFCSFLPIACTVFHSFISARVATVSTSITTRRHAARYSCDCLSCRLWFGQSLCGFCDINARNAVDSSERLFFMIFRFISTAGVEDAERRRNQMFKFRLVSAVFCAILFTYTADCGFDFLKGTRFSTHVDSKRASYGGRVPTYYIWHRPWGNRVNA